MKRLSRLLSFHFFSPPVMFLSRLYSPLSWGNVYGLVLGYKEPLSLHKDVSMGASISNVPTMSDKLSQFVARSSRFFF